MYSKACQINSPNSLARVGHWVGELKLTMSSPADKTVVTKKSQLGPYSVQRAIYPENNPRICHLIILHPPGGLVEGDKLSLSVICDQGAHLFLTTPSAGKVYCCDQIPAEQNQYFKVSDDSKLEWFPQELILFENSISRLDTFIELQGSARFAGWEIICLGRNNKSALLDNISTIGKIEIRRDGVPVFIDRIVLNPEHDTNGVYDSAWGLDNKNVVGTLIINSVTKTQLEAVRRICGETEATCKLGLTLIDGFLICRGLASQSRDLKSAFIDVWKELRESVFEEEPHFPRIWRT